MNKNLLVLLILVLGAVTALAQDTSGAIAVDGSGNLYKTGPSAKVLGEGKGYVTVKYDDKGNQLWVARYNDPSCNQDLSGVIELDESGNSYVTLKNSKDEKLATICYSPYGDEVWVRKYDDSTKGASQKLVLPAGPSKASTPPPYENGWPFMGAIMNINIDQSLVAGNLDVSDAQEELVLCMYNDVYAWNHDGTLLTGWPKNPGNVNFRGASIGVQGGIGRVAFSNCEYAPTNAYIFNYDGSGVNGWPKPTYPILHSQAWADIDGDGIREVVAVGTWEGSTEAGRVYVWNIDGSDVPGFPVDVGDCISRLAVGDVNNDGANEIVAVSNRKIHLISSSGTILWERVASGFPSLADLDGDGDLEILLSADQYLYAWDSDGNEFWPRKDLSNGGSDLSPIAIGDLDGDGSLEVVACNSACVYVWDKNGNLKQGWPLSIPNVYWTFTTVEGGLGPAIGDIDGDGREEIVLNAWDTNSGWNIYALHPDGTVVDGFPYVEQSGFDATSTPVIADLDKDGNVEICSYGQSHDNPYSTLLRVVVYDLHTPYDSSRMDWPMLSHDPERTGCLEGAVIGERIRGDVNEDGRITVSDVIFLVNYLFKGGSAPAPLEVGDVNCDSSVTVSDVVYLINYLFKSGPPPC